MNDAAFDLAFSLQLNDSEFPNRCLLLKFSIGVDLFEVLIVARHDF